MSTKNRNIIQKPLSGSETDVIVYIVNSLGGGIDGRDPSDKSKPVYASFDRDEARSRVTNWDKKHLEKKVIVLEEQVRSALNKLNVVEQLALRKHMEPVFCNELISSKNVLTKE